MNPIVLPNGVRLREFYAPEETRTQLLDNVHQAYKERFPLENDRVKIDLLDSYYDKNKLNYTLAQQKKALIQGDKVSVPLKALVKLSDKVTGQELETKELTLANVPWLTQRNTFINGGIEYAVGNQYRLRHGVFARRKDNGELESHINTKSGTGPQMRMFMEPDTGVYRLKVQQANLKLYPILKAIGAEDSYLETIWGPEVFKANVKAFDSQSVSKMYEKLLRNKANPDLSVEEKAIQIKEQLARAQLDPEITQRTLGKPYVSVDSDMLTATSLKLLKINKGEVKQDDRDSLANKSVHSIEDFMPDKVRKDHGGVMRGLLFKIGYDRTLRHLRPGCLTPQLESSIISNSLSMPISGINLMEFRDTASRGTVMGEGGIGSMDSIPITSRNVHSSYLNFQDPIRSSESRAIGIDSRFANKVLKGTDNQIYAPFMNKKTNQIEYVTPSFLNDKVVGFAQSDSVTL